MDEHAFILVAQKKLKVAITRDTCGHCYSRGTTGRLGRPWDDHSMEGFKFVFEPDDANDFQGTWVTREDVEVLGKNRQKALERKGVVCQKNPNERTSSPSAPVRTAGTTTSRLWVTATEAPSLYYWSTTFSSSEDGLEDI